MVRMNKRHRAAILAHAEDAYPYECCGFLLGKAENGLKTVTAVRQAVNTRRDSARNRYQISPGEQLAVDRAARREELDVVGFYHSHPDSTARPSDHDRRHAWPWYTYLIVPVASGRAGEPLSWVLPRPDGPFEEEALEVLTPGA